MSGAVKKRDRDGPTRALLAMLTVLRWWGMLQYATLSNQERVIQGRNCRERRLFKKKFAYDEEGVEEGGEKKKVSRVEDEENNKKAKVNNVA